MVDLEEAKKRFLQRYNPPMSEELALTSGLKAAAQRNPLYRTNAVRRDARHRWKEEMKRLARRYEATRSLTDYESDIEDLKHVMNATFGDRFIESGFRVSHAQKSLSVLLKHLWCLDQIPTPPACPVDRRVMQAIDRRWSKPWTKVDTMEAHRDMFGRIQAAAAAEGLNVAEWELVTFAG